ncbi:MAG: tRNA epoxyqueuosine(34) reductase QueG [Thermoplasmata archaeon]|nr:MAG: tRNA epoxyqueuosine(34) reductase QueG [Thermoplasmata archaeon]
MKTETKSATRNPLSHFVEKAKSLGFTAVGFSRPGAPLFFDRFQAWISGGKQGDMHWIERHAELRENPGKLLEGCRTIITLAYPYSSRKPFTPDGFASARYTEPGRADYHDRLRKLAKTLAQNIIADYPGTRTRVCVDSAPMLERSFAYASGIGFIGKNNMLIIPGHGSYVFLTEILTTAPLEFLKAETMENQCGSCTLCVEACPAGALEMPFSLNASKCLSYLTIEHGGEVDSETGRKMGDCFFGCDVCQEICPFNDKPALRDMSLASTEEML